MRVPVPPDASATPGELRGEGSLACVSHEAPSHAQVGLLLAYAGGGVLMTLVAALAGAAEGVVWLLGLFLVCHALVVAASWLPRDVISQRLDTFLDKWVADVGGGFYGLMALALFVGLEAEALLDDVTGFDFSAGAIGGALIPWLVGFSIESLLNSLWAIIWPVFVLELGVLRALVLVGAAWGLFALGSRVFPQPAFLQAKKRPWHRTKQKKNSNEAAAAGESRGGGPSSPP